MADRSLKRSRHVSTTDDSDSEGTDDWSPQNSGLNAARRPSPARDDAFGSRSRRRTATAAAAAAATTTNQRADPGSKRPIRLNVKPAPSRLRQVMDAEPARESLSRSSKNKKTVYQEPSEDEDVEDEDEEIELEEDEGEEEEEPEEDEDEEMEAPLILQHDDDEEDEEDEDEEDQDQDDEEAASSEGQSAQDASEQPQEDDDEEEEEEDEEDEEMRDPSVEPYRPSIKLKAPTMTDRERQQMRERAQSPRRKLARQGKLKSVEDKEIQLAGSGRPSEDEELSDADDADSDEEDEEADEASEEPDDEDLPNDALDTIRASAIGDDELSDDSISDSRAGTPDPSKLTRRQRGIDDDNSLLALSNEAQKKKVFTAQEITMRRAEMARRRKDLSEKRNEEEKADTLNRLLHKQAPKRRTRAQIMADAEREEFGTPGLEEGGYPKPKSMYVRTVMAVGGTRVGVPGEWLDKPVGRLFNGAVPPQKQQGAQSGTRMVQVVE